MSAKNVTLHDFNNFGQILHLLTIIDNFWQFWQLRQSRQFLTILTIEKTVLETCDIWDTEYNSDNWEPELMTWQLIVTLDSIHNSCDV